jgi:hypothetical protein
MASAILMYVLCINPQRREVFFFTTTSRLLLGPSQSLTELEPGVKQPGCEADHSPPSSAEVRNAWSCTFPPPYVFMVCCLIEQRTCLHDMLLSYTQGQFCLHQFVNIVDMLLQINMTIISRI